MAGPVADAIDTMINRTDMSSSNLVYWEDTK